MTENEAIKALSYDDTAYGGRCTEEVRKVAVQALERVQQFEAIGTIEEFKALKEKSMAKKPLRIPDDDTCVYYGYYCPCCNEPLSNTARMKRCFCGQLLDWSE